jgi:hypothetical protein
MTLGVAQVAAAQRYSLQLRPRAGDTLRLKMEQTTEFEGTHGHALSGAGGKGTGKADTTAYERSALSVYTRIAVEATDLDGADVTAITDSVRLTNSAGGDALAAAARAAEGRRVRLHVAPDGATTVASAEGAAAGPLKAVITQMPATLPRDPVEVGQSWVRTMEIPVAAASAGGLGGSAALSGTFKLDSVSKGGEIAYVSLTGRLVRSTNVPYAPESNARGRRGARTATVSTSGSITGNIVIDRTRGWITDVRTSVVSRSLMQESGSATASARMWMKISQRVQVY